MSRNKLLPLLLIFFFVAVVGLSGGERFLAFFHDGPLPTPSSHQLHHVHDDTPPAPAPAPAHVHARARSLGHGGCGGGLNSFIHYRFPQQLHSSRIWPVRNIPFYLLLPFNKQQSIVTIFPAFFLFFLHLCIGVEVWVEDCGRYPHRFPWCCSR